MGVENRSSGGGSTGGGAVASVRPSLGGGSLALAREFGPVMTAADIGPISKGGLAKGGVENMSYIFIDSNLIRGGNRFNVGIPTTIQEPVAQPDIIATEVVREAETILFQARPHLRGELSSPLIAEEVVTEAEHILGLDKLKLSTEAVIYPDAPKLEAVRKKISLFFEEKQSHGLSREAGQSHGLLGTNQNTAIPEIVIAPQTQPDVITPFIPAPALEPASKVDTTLVVQSLTQPQTETKTAQIIQTSLAPIVEEQIEELVEKEVVTDGPEETLENMEEERAADFKLSHAVDPKALEIRTRAVIEGAIKVAVTEGVSAKIETEGISQAINGQEIVDNIVAKQSIRYRGQELNKIDPRGNLPDGGWEVNQKKIDNTNFDSIADAVQRLPKILAEDPPVLEGEGKSVTDENVATSLKYAPDKIHPAQIVIKRVVSMKKQVKVIKRSRQQPVQIIPIEEKIIEKNEGTPHPELAAALRVPQTT